MTFTIKGIAVERIVALRLAAKAGSRRLTSTSQKRRDFGTDFGGVGSAFSTKREDIGEPLTESEDSGELLTEREDSGELLTELGFRCSTELLGHCSNQSSSVELASMVVKAKMKSRCSIKDPGRWRRTVLGRE
jgi:hypothetical protein